MDSFDGEPHPYHVTPYYPAGDFRRALTSGQQTGTIDKGLARLEELHAIVQEVHKTTTHRDLKPENILVDQDGKLLLCDLGLCLPLHDEPGPRRSETLEQIGSRHYIAPEALGGLKAVQDHIALDLYSVGKIAYEMFAGDL